MEVIIKQLTDFNVKIKNIREQEYSYLWLLAEIETTKSEINKQKLITETNTMRNKFESSFRIPLSEFYDKNYYFNYEKHIRSLMEYKLKCDDKNKTPLVVPLMEDIIHKHYVLYTDIYSYIRNCYQITLQKTGSSTVNENHFYAILCSYGTEVSSKIEYYIDQLKELDKEWKDILEKEEEIIENAKTLQQDADAFRQLKKKSKEEIKAQLKEEILSKLGNDFRKQLEEEIREEIKREISTKYKLKNDDIATNESE